MKRYSFKYCLTNISKLKAVEDKVDEVAVVFDREEERKELAPITVISTISLEVNTLKNLSRCHFDHLTSTLRDHLG